MVKEIRWTPEALKSFQKVIDYLETNWTEKEVKSFITSTNRVAQFISQNPKMFRATNHQDLREALVTPHNLLIYKIQKTSIDLITFWDVRQNPRKKIKK
jgi:plasmid stabilization system protein ParE